MVSSFRVGESAKSLQKKRNEGMARYISTLLGPSLPARPSRDCDKKTYPWASRMALARSKQAMRSSVPSPPGDEFVPAFDKVLLHDVVTSLY